MTKTGPSAVPPRIPITKPLIGSEEAEAVAEVLASGWLVQGRRVHEFEAQFAAFTGAGNAVAATSCTTALHLAVAALGLQPGQEVIVPAFTWISTANVVEYMGARPVFVDIEPRTFNIDVDRAIAAVTDRTVGIIPVHLFGLCADMPRINELARERGLWVLEDAACGFGARIGRGHAGTLGTAGCFSFHPRKAITTGEGGMLTTQDAGLAEAARSLRDHGADRTDLERHSASDGTLLPAYRRLGFNYRMTDVQAAIGVVQLGRAQQVLATRRRQAERYDDALDQMPWLTAPHVPEGYTHGYQSYVAWFGEEGWETPDVQAASGRRNRYMSMLQERGIATRQGTHAAALQEFYTAKYGLQPSDYPVSFAADRLTVSLPMFATMTEDEQNYVVAALADVATIE
jgi:perosamine synthetase